MDNLINIKGYSEYFITLEGIVYKRKKVNKKDVESTEYKYVKVNPYTEARYGFSKINLERDDKKRTTELLGTLAYKSFHPNEESFGEIVYIDEDKANCSIENLVSVKTLIEVYKTSLNK